MHTMDMTSPFSSLQSPLLVLVVSLFLSLFSFLLLFTKKSRPLSSNGGRRLPPSPWGLPILGHLPLLGSLPHRKLRSLAQAHGPVMLIRLGGVPAVVVTSAAAAQEVLKTRDLAFASRAPVRMAELLFYGRDMAFAPYGEYWRQARRVCVHHLLSARRVASFRRVREQEAAALLDRVRRVACASRPDGGAVVDLTRELISYTNTIISRATFGDDGGYGIGDGLSEVFADLEELLGTVTVGQFVPWLAWVDTLMGIDAKAARTSKVLDELLERVIADHRQRRLGGGRLVGDGEQDDHRDFVDVLLDVSEALEDTGDVEFDAIAIKAIAMDMFAAATNTTYTTLVWAMAELINQPAEMRKLQDEIRAAVVNNGGGSHVNEDHLAKLQYLRPVIKETLRLHSPLPLLLPRETLEDTELLGYRVPARTRVVINAWAIGRDPETWERAEEFVPERFVGGPVEYGVRHDDFSSVPFGGGRRGCPGVGFATPTMELALASLLYHFDWEQPGAAGVSKLDMSELYGLSVRLKANLCLVAKPWSP